LAAFHAMKLAILLFLLGASSVVASAAALVGLGGFCVNLFCS
jgi:hypothetical protein